MPTIELRPSVQRFLDMLCPEELQTALDGIRKLEGSSRPGGVLWRMRAEDYRILYSTDEDRDTVTVLYIGRRGDIYGPLKTADTSG